MLTEQQILYKLTSLCARSEYCIDDMRKKMQRWETPDDMQQRVIDFLLRERYVDEERFARAFIRSKAELNKWGSHKIEQALRLKHIPTDVFKPLLEELLTEESTQDTLTTLLRNKLRSVKADTDYERRGKLIRFALQRGFSMDDTLRAIDNLITTD